MARTAPNGPARLPRSMVEDLYDASVRLASVLETLEVLMDKGTMKRIKSGERQYSKHQHVIAKGLLEIRKALSS